MARTTGYCVSCPQFVSKAMTKHASFRHQIMRDLAEAVDVLWSGTELNKIT
jgi:hypothetical protein